MGPDRGCDDASLRFEPAGERKKLTFVLRLCALCLHLCVQAANLSTRSDSLSSPWPSLLSTCCCVARKRSGVTMQALSGGGGGGACGQRSKRALIGLLLLVLVVQTAVLYAWMQQANDDDAIGGGSGRGSSSGFGALRLGRLLGGVGRRKSGGSDGSVCIDASAPPSAAGAQVALKLLKAFVEKPPPPPPPAPVPALPPAPSEPAEIHFDRPDRNDHASPRLLRHFRNHSSHASGSGSGSGSAPPHDDYLHHHEAGEPRHSAGFLSRHADFYASKLRLQYSAAWATDQLEPDAFHGLSQEDWDIRQLCMHWWQKYRVELESNWGDLPRKYQPAFDEDCSEVVSRIQTAHFIRNNSERTNHTRTAGGIPRGGESCSDDGGPWSATTQRLAD